MNSNLIFLQPSFEEAQRWKTEVLHVCLVILKNQQPVSALETVICGRSFDAFAGLISPDA